MKIGIVTFSRSEYNSCLSIMQSINSEKNLELQLIVSGSHLSPEFGYTIDRIKSDGFDIKDEVEMLLSSDTAAGISKSIGLGIIGFSQVFSKERPDLLLVIGDRYELFSVVLAAMNFKIPIAHVSGGDITKGALDDQIRHSVSKISHIHFVSMERHAHRLIQMGEEPWRIFVTGDPALDLISNLNFISRENLIKKLGLNFSSPVILITMHPTTLGAIDNKDAIKKLLDALSKIDGTFIFTYPNSDEGYKDILEEIREFIKYYPNSDLFESLGTSVFYSLLNQVDAMVGNSSSGIWEAPSFKLPVVNIGDRQEGRYSAKNVINSTYESGDILDSIKMALSPSFKNSLSGLKNPYGDGNAASRIIDVLKSVKIDHNLMKKEFVEINFELE